MGDEGARKKTLQHRTSADVVSSTSHFCRWVILVNMEISVILGHEKTKIKNIKDYGKIDIFSVRTNIYIKNKKMGHLI